VIDEFKDGVVMVKQNKNISYQNKPINGIFGIRKGEKIGDKEKHITLKMFKYFEKCNQDHQD